MYLLRKRIKSWRAELLAYCTMSPAEATELEDHLFTEATHLAEAGKSDEEAVAEALRRLGTLGELQQEYELSHTTGSGSMALLFPAAMRLLYHLCRLLNAIVIVILPAFALVVPAMGPASLLRRDFWAPAPSSSESALLWLLAQAHGDTAPLLVATFAVAAVFVYPIWYQARQCRGFGGNALVAAIAQETGGYRRFLVYGILGYPVIAYVLLVLAYRPLWTTIKILG